MNRRLASAVLATGLTLTALSPAAAHDWEREKGHHSSHEHGKKNGHHKKDHDHKNGRWSEEWEWPWDRDHKHDRWDKHDHDDRWDDKDPDDKGEDPETPDTTTPLEGDVRTGIVTGYTVHDNDPVGSTTLAWGGQAGGTGTYEDPITVATEIGDYERGTIIYIPHLLRYFTVEDSCMVGCPGEQEWLDVWVGGSMDNSPEAAQACSSELTRLEDDLAEFIVNPDPSLPVDPGPLFDADTETCNVPDGTETPEPGTTDPDTTDPDETATGTAFVTAYAIHDNDPPGSREIAYPVIHEEAGGTGTYEDPTTVSAPAGRYDPGTKFYLPHLDRYFILEDLCATSHSAPNGCTADLDVWIGGTLDDSEEATRRCNESVTGDYPFILNPEPGLPVSPGPIYNSDTDTCYEPTPDTAPAGSS